MTGWKYSLKLIANGELILTHHEVATVVRSQVVKYTWHRNTILFLLVTKPTIRWHWRSILRFCSQEQLGTEKLTMNGNMLHVYSY